MYYNFFVSNSLLLLLLLPYLGEGAVMVTDYLRTYGYLTALAIGESENAITEVPEALIHCQDERQRHSY